MLSTKTRHNDYVHYALYELKTYIDGLRDVIIKMDGNIFIKVTCGPAFLKFHTDEYLNPTVDEFYDVVEFLNTLGFLSLDT
jgi:hypothetical protein